MRDLYGLENIPDIELEILSLEQMLKGMGGGQVRKKGRSKLVFPPKTETEMLYHETSHAILDGNNINFRESSHNELLQIFARIKEKGGPEQLNETEASEISAKIETSFPDFFYGALIDDVLAYYGNFYLFDSDTHDGFGPITETETQDDLLKISKQIQEQIGTLEKIIKGEIKEDQLETIIMPGTPLTTQLAIVYISLEKAYSLDVILKQKLKQKITEKFSKHYANEEPPLNIIISALGRRAAQAVYLTQEHQEIITPSQFLQAILHNQQREEVSDNLDLYFQSIYPSIKRYEEDLEE